jgi:hypothetical protein
LLKLQVTGATGGEAKGSKVRICWGIAPLLPFCWLSVHFLSFFSVSGARIKGIMGYTKFRPCKIQFQGQKIPRPKSFTISGLVFQLWTEVYEYFYSFFFGGTNVW